MANTAKISAWSLLTFDELEAWRSEQKIPAIRLASLLGFSNSTYHNWKSGRAIPNESMQERLRGLIDGLEEVPASATRGGGKARAKADALPAEEVIEHTIEITSDEITDTGEETTDGPPRVSSNTLDSLRSEFKGARPLTPRVSKGASSRKAVAQAETEVATVNESGEAWVAAVVASYLEANPVRTLEDLQRTVSAIRAVI